MVLEKKALFGVFFGILDVTRCITWNRSNFTELK